MTLRPARQTVPDRPCLGASVQTAVDAEIIVCHSLCRESLHEAAPDPSSIDPKNLRHDPDCFVERSHEASGNALVNNLGRRTAPEGEHWRRASHGFDHDQAKRLWPIDWKQQRARFPQEACLVALADFAQELDARSREKRCDRLSKVRYVRLVDLGGYLQRHAQGARDLNGPVGALLPRDPPEKGEIAAARLIGRREEIRRQSMIDSLNEIRVRYRRSLRV